MNQIEMINKLMAKVDDLLHAPYTGTTPSGLPMTRGIVIINDHRVDVIIIDKVVYIELDKSTQRHTLAEAIALIAK